jgi:AcrR family transcriptional regulator
MTRIATAGIGSRGPRAYSSQLRAQQAEDTRGRILDATVRVMARGIASVSIPAVAREAGVSIPTVYRHFGTKADLLAAVYPHIERRAGFDQMVPPRSIDDLRAGVHTIFERLESFDDLARAAMASPAAEESRRLNMPDRLAMTRRLADSITPRLSEADRDRIARLLVVLTASSSLRMWRDHLGASVGQAADDVDWVVRAAIAAIAASTPKEPA